MPPSRPVHSDRIHVSMATSLHQPRRTRSIAVAPAVFLRAQVSSPAFSKQGIFRLFHVASCPFRNFVHDLLAASGGRVPSGAEYDYSEARSARNVFRAFS